MRRLSITATTLLVLFVFAITPCFAQVQGTFNVTNNSVGDFGSWASTSNAKPLVGDFNGDGKTDVALTGASGWNFLPVAFSNGDGTFNVTNKTMTQNFPFWAATAGAIPFVGDFNGDGKADVLLTGARNWTTLAVAFSNGDGTFNVTNVTSLTFAVEAAAANVKQVVGDFNGDGKTDVALLGGFTWNFVPVAFSNGDGTFNVTAKTTATFASLAITPRATPLVGDFNNDGRDDLALIGPFAWSFLPVAFSNGDGTFNVTQAPISNFAGWATAANAKPLVGDFNADGRTDVALTGASSWNFLPVAFSNGDGTFNVTNPTMSQNFPFWAATAGAIPLVGDFNADGRADVTLTSAPNWTTLAVAFSNGDGTFNVTNQSITNFASWAAQANAKPLVGDFNGDGRSDVALTGASGWTTLPVAFSLSPAVTVVNMIPATLSGETNQDSEPFLALNPDFPTRMVGTAFTPNPGYPANTTSAPIYVSQNSGFTWVLNTIVPSGGDRGTSDITVVGVGDPTANRLYSGILAVPGTLQLHELTTADFTSATLMTSQSSRSQVDQPFVQGLRSGGADRVYVGNKDFEAEPTTATVDVTASGGASWNSVQIDKRTGSCNDHLPPTRPAVAPDGTVYAAFFHCTSRNGSMYTSDVVVVRDDAWATGTTPFTSLIDPGDQLAGMRVVTNVTIPWDPNAALGNQRIGSALSLAVDPSNSNIVYLGWADRVGNGDIYTIHIRCSTNRGVTWSTSDLLTVTNATNLALAIGNSGTVGALYQQVTGTGTNQSWLTTLVQTRNAFAASQQTILSTAPVTAPVFQPYLGDYIYLIAVGTQFRGVFSANNTPNLANFPQGVIYQRQVNFNTMTLLNGTATVAASIDPFYFSVAMMI